MNNEDIATYLRAIGSKGGKKTAQRADISEIRRKAALLRWQRYRKYKAALDKETQ